MSRYMPYLYTHKVWKKIKDTFDIPSPSHPIKLGPALNPEGALKVLECKYDFQNEYDFQNYTMDLCFKSERKDSILNYKLGF